MLIPDPHGTFVKQSGELPSVSISVEQPERNYGNPYPYLPKASSKNQWTNWLQEIKQVTFLSPPLDLLVTILDKYTRHLKPKPDSLHVCLQEKHRRIKKPVFWETVKCFIIFCNSPDTALWGGSMCFHFQMRKLRLREVKQLSKVTQDSGEISNLNNAWLALL